MPTKCMCLGDTIGQTNTGKMAPVCATKIILNTRGARATQKGQQKRIHGMSAYAQSSCDNTIKSVLCEKCIHNLYFVGMYNTDSMRWTDKKAFDHIALSLWTGRKKSKC